MAMGRTLFLVAGIVSISWFMSLVGMSNTSTSSKQSMGSVKSKANNDQEPQYSTNSNNFYTTRRLGPHFGIEALGIDLRDPSLLSVHKDRFIAQLTQDLVRHRAILFRSQDISGDLQIYLSKAIGPWLDSGYPAHPKTPHPDIYRISNNRSEGFTGVGFDGWHVDGLHTTRPYTYTALYVPSASKGGETHFIPLKELLDLLSAEEKEYYRKIWFKTQSDLVAPFHPMVYKHPFRKGEETMILHCARGKNQWYIDDENTTMHEVEDVTRLMRPVDIKDELTEILNSKLDEIGTRMEWQTGDFFIFDNLGLTHHASTGSQKAPKDVGLRVLHRTTIWKEESFEGELHPTTMDGKKSFTLDRAAWKDLKSKAKKELERKAGVLEEGPDLEALLELKFPSED